MATSSTVIKNIITSTISSVIIDEHQIDQQENNNNYNKFDNSSFVFTTADYTCFAFLLSVSAGIGVYFGFFSKSVDTTDEYLMGSRKFKTLPIAISLVSSQMSAISIMTIPSEVYAFGTHYIWLIFSMMLVVPILCYIIVPVFYNNNISNCYEYLEMRFDKKIRRMVTAAFIFKVYLLIPVYIFVPSLAFSQVTGWNIHFINAVVCSVCIFYTMLGGIKAVVWTDVIQALIMLGSVVLVALLAVIKVGGVGEVFHRAYVGGRLDGLNFKLDLITRNTVWNSFLGGLALWISHIGVHQCCVQRIVSLPSLAHARKALVIFAFGFLTMMSMNYLTGIVMFARYYLCEPVTAGVVEKYDKLMPFFVQDVIGHLSGMPGIFISCVFSAALSTVSANLNTLSGLVYFDYIKPFIQHTESRANYIMKIIVILNGIYCVLGGFIVENCSSILQIASSISGVTQGAVAGVFLLGMLYPKAHAKSALYGSIASMVIMAIVIIGAQFQINAGTFKYTPLPASVEQCEQEFNITISTKSKLDELFSTTSSPVVDESFSIFHISFFWYSFLGCSLVWLISVPLSHLIENNEEKKLDIKLMTPCIQRFVPKILLQPEEVPLKSDYENNILKEQIIITEKKGIIV